MDPVSIENLVDRVIAAFDARRRTHWQPTTLALTGDDGELQQWRQLVEERLATFRNTVVDRAALIERVRRRFHNVRWTADFAGVADELQEMARDDLRAYLTSRGMPETAARKVAAGYSIGALLHEQ